MASPSRPAVERVTPPKAPYRVVNRVNLRGQREGLSLVCLDVPGASR